MALLKRRLIDAREEFQANGRGLVRRMLASAGDSGGAPSREEEHALAAVTANGGGAALRGEQLRGGMVSVEKADGRSRAAGATPLLFIAIFVSVALNVALAHLLHRYASHPAASPDKQHDTCVHPDTSREGEAARVGEPKYRSAPIYISGLLLPMVKKRAVAAKTTMTTPVFPFPAAAAETWPPHHFSDPQLLCSSQLPETKRAAAGHHHQQPPPPLEPARFKLQKPISKKKHRHTQQQHDHKQRRRWWSSAASAALLFFRRPSRKCSPAARTAGAASSSSCRTARTAFAPSGPLYFADDGGDDSTPGCACWSPAVRPGHLTAAEFGSASAAVPYINLGGCVGGPGGVAPSMPIYLVT